MQLQFHKTTLACLCRTRGDIQTQEQTQELRLSEEMPDAVGVIGAWGQVLIRSKERHAVGADLSCGVMTWVLYQPEDGSSPRMVEAWIPFSFRWDLPAVDKDGAMNVSCLLRCIEARPVSARRLMIRATVGVVMDDWSPIELEVAEPKDLPEDICLLKKTYPLRLYKEAGEKSFSMEEELTLPGSMPAMDQLLRYALQPEIMETKVMAGKIVFRGVARLHLLYNGQDGRLYSFSQELPFSQYGDLQQLYEPEAEASVYMAVTSLELEKGPDGTLHLNAGLTGQYVISDMNSLTLVEDAYSTCHPVTLQREVLDVPVCLESASHELFAEAKIPAEGGLPVDVAFYPDHPRLNRTMEGGELHLGGLFQLLICDQEGKVIGTTTKWHETKPVLTCPDSQLIPQITPVGEPLAIQGGDITLQSPLELSVQRDSTKGLSMVTALEVGENTEPNPDRPSLILRRAGDDSLWNMAKATGSTVDAVLKANGLQEEPPQGTMLLIPVP